MSEEAQATAAGRGGARLGRDGERERESSGGQEKEGAQKRSCYGRPARHRTPHCHILLLPKTKLLFGARAQRWGEVGR
jgi:hypothetical protein